MIPTLFTASCLWQGPSDSEKIIYFAGTSKKHPNPLKPHYGHTTFEMNFNITLLIIKLKINQN